MTNILGIALNIKSHMNIDIPITTNTTNLLTTSTNLSNAPSKLNEINKNNYSTNNKIVFNNHILVVATTALYTYELLDPRNTENNSNNTDSNNMYDDNSTSNSTASSKPQSPSNRRNSAQFFNSTTLLNSDKFEKIYKEKWIDISGKIVYDYHKSSIDILCLSARSSTFITYSAVDLTVRVWDYMRPYSKVGQYL